MKTMLSVAYNYLKEVEHASFEKIWKEIIKQMKVQWKKQFNRVLLKDIEEEKIGELYTLLTIDGRFVRDNEDQWSLIEDHTFEEVKQMRINIGEKDQL